MSKVRVALIGMGKMGRAIAQLAPDRDVDIVARIDAADPANTRITKESLAGAQVAIEFTVPAAAPANIRMCLAAGTPVVVGTTSAARSPITVSSGSQVRARAREIRPSATITTPAVSVTASSGQIGASTLPSSFI